MRQKHIFKKLLTITILVFFLIITLLILDNKRMWDYYKTEDAFISSQGVVTYINHDEQEGQIYLSLSGIAPCFDDNCFKIVGLNYKIVMENGLLDQLRIGDTVEFVGSPRVFGDGYVLPLIAISAHDTHFLIQEQGYPNFMDWLRSK